MTGRSRRAFGTSMVAMACAAGVGLMLPAPAAAAPCLPLMCKFSISGKKGRYLEKQVTAEALAKADAATTAGLGDGRSLEQQSINKGAFAGTGLSMPQTERALMQIIARLQAGWPHRQPRILAVRIVGATDYNPTAFPDGTIVVPLGLLIQATSDDEIAWVLAHEFSHVALAHFSREAQQRRLKASINNIVACARTGIDLAQHRVDNNGGQLRITPSANKGMLAVSTQIWAKSELVGTALEAFNQRLSRRQEDQADAAGIDLALKAGFSDSGYGTALDVIERAEKRTAGLMAQFQSEMGRYLKISAARSIDKLNKGASLEKVGGGVLDDMKRNVAQMLFEKAVEVVTASHRPPRKRKEGLANYLNAAYSDAAPPEPAHVLLDALRATPEFLEAQKAVNARDRALGLLSQEPVNPDDIAQVTKAYAAATQAIVALAPAFQTRYAHTPLIANAAAKIDYMIGDYAGADRNYDLAERGPQAAAKPAAPVKVAKGRAARSGKGKGKPPPVVAAPPPPPAPLGPVDAYLQQSLEGYREHVDLLVERRNYTKALAVIALAKSRLKDDTAFLPALVTIHAQTRNALLTDTFDRCMRTGDEALSNACHMALLDPQQLQKLQFLTPDDMAKLQATTAAAVNDATRGGMCKQLMGAMGTTEE